MREDRPYQATAIAAVQQAWNSGHRSVCLVAPTGAGKTHMAGRLALAPGGTVLWSAHRTELVKQGFSALHSIIGGESLGIIAPGHTFEPSARVQVSSTQTLVRSGKPAIEPSVIVLDEFHHYPADEFKALTEWWPKALVLGPTATPERGDGKPLGNIATALVVAAHYQDLIRDGFLCDAVVYQPPYTLDGMAQDPVDAWIKYGGGMSGFAFMPTIAIARELADSFNARGIGAACIDAKTPKRERALILERFAAGELDVICNVDTMTEGVDVPRAGVAMLGRKFLTVGAYLQACGRVLRPHPDKPYARIIDLTGCSHFNLPPTINREYSLEGNGIRRGDGGGANPVRNCPKCGRVYLCADPYCPDCGSHPTPKVKRPPVILSVELQEVWAGEYTKPDAKQREYKRLREEAKKRGLRLYAVERQYRALFGEAPKFFDATPAEKKVEFYAMVKEGETKGARGGYAAKRFRDMFGHWPKGI